MTSTYLFLMITGLSPQIITETLYAYYVGTGLDDSIPTEVHLITTTEGSERAGLTLLEPVTGQFHKLLDAYSINNLSFTEDHIHVLTDAHSERLRDIRTPEDNTAAANFICEWVKKFTLDDDTQLMVSIAGGRKTMGYYAGYALTLFGRHQDQLSHVLVSEEFEGNRDFFFPTRQTEIVYSHTNKPLDTSRAEVTLAQIPFVRLRQELPKNSLVARLGFEDTVGEGKNLALQDIRFARTINRIQKSMIQELNKIAIIHLYILGLEDELDNFTLSLNNPSTQAEMLKIEQTQLKVTLYKDAVADAGNGFGAMSMTRGKKEILGMSDEDIRNDLEQQRLEKAASAEMEQTANIIKKTGLFDRVDKLYGDFDTLVSDSGGGSEEGAADEVGGDDGGFGGDDGGWVDGAGVGVALGRICTCTSIAR